MGENRYQLPWLVIGIYSVPIIIVVVAVIAGICAR